MYSQRSRFRPLALITILAGCGLLGASAGSAVEGPPITNNNYSVDMARTTVTGPARKIAMGGAYAAIAGGATSLSDNPASVSVRAPGSTDQWDWGGMLNAMNATGKDIDNNDSTSSSYHKNTLLNASFLAQLYNSAAGFYFADQFFDIDGPAGRNHVDLANLDLIAGTTQLKGQFSWGIALRLAGMSMKPDQPNAKDIIDINGAGMNVGFLWNPHKGPWTWGFVYKTPTNRTQSLPTSTGPVVAGGLIVPDSVAVPWETSLGTAYQTASAPFWADHPFVVSADVRVIGPVRNAVGVESLVEQKVQRSGGSATLVPHLGTELESWKNYLRLRVGTYYEPSRFDNVSARTHATGGLEVKLFHLPWFGDHYVSFSYGIDYAARYLNNSFSIGFWH